MFDQEILASQVNADHFPFLCEGDITLTVRNTNYALGPVMLYPRHDSPLGHHGASRR